MENNLEEVDTSFGLDDCDLLSCRYENSNFHMIIRTWNYLEVKLSFYDCIFFTFRPYFFFSKLLRTNAYTEEFKDILEEYYEGNIPNDQPFTYYTITNSLNHPAVELVCKNMKILSIVNLLEKNDN